jgi:hypothetical protein
VPGLPANWNTPVPLRVTTAGVGVSVTVGAIRSLGVTVVEGALVGPAPTALVAVTVKVYLVPLVSPVKVALRAVPGTVRLLPPGVAVMVYPVIGDPPSSVGAVQVTVAKPSLASAEAPPPSPRPGHWALILSGVGTVAACRQVGITRMTGYRCGVPSEAVCRRSGWPRLNEVLLPVGVGAAADPPCAHRACRSGRSPAAWAGRLRASCSQPGCPDHPASARARLAHRSAPPRDQTAPRAGHRGRDQCGGASARSRGDGVSARERFLRSAGSGAHPRR